MSQVRKVKSFFKVQWLKRAKAVVKVNVQAEMESNLIREPRMTCDVNWVRQLIVSRVGSSIGDVEDGKLS